MPERRQSHRRLPFSELFVVDKLTDQPLGAIRDMTSGGCKLICREPIPAGQLFDCRMSLPEPILECKVLNFWVESKWCSFSEGENMFEVGFEFRDLTEIDRMLIKFLVVPWEDAKAEEVKASVAKSPVRIHK